MKKQSWLAEGTVQADADPTQWLDRKRHEHRARPGSLGDGD